ncbi:radical SAM protein [Clostridiaceae bacterium M8S5]|nr:radical SAM protein [Clostridiaceae bacterium M8S5]
MITIFKLSNRAYYEITNACNLSCIHCCNYTEEDVNFLDIDDILQFHSNLSKYGIVDSVITGGEPTLHNDFEELTERMCEIGNVVVTSNGVARDAKYYLDLVSRNEKIFLQVSLDGMSEKTHDVIRGKGNLKKVIDTINYIAEAGYAHRVGLSMTIMKQNISEVRKLVSFAREKGIASVHFPTLVCVGKGNDNWDDIAPSIKEQIEIEEYLLTELCNKESNTKISVNRLNHIIESLEPNNKEYQLCVPTLKVDCFGNLFACPIASGEKNKIGSMKEFKSLESCISTIERRIKSNVINVKKVCKECDVADICTKNFCEVCTLNHLETNSQSNKYACQIYKHHYREIKKIEI